MLAKTQTLIFNLAILIGLSSPLAVPAIASAQVQGHVCGGVNDLKINSSASCATTGAEPCQLQCVVNNVINLLSVIVGIVAVVMIIIGGFRYVTSAGNEQSVASAKKTLIYAIVGLVIAVLAQVIARFVLNKTAG